MAGKSPLFVKKQPGGKLSIIDQSMTTGNVWFVDSGTGTDGAGYGQNPDAPFATIDYAIGKCTVNNGDRIYAMPGHAETVAGAAGIDFDRAGIKCLGLGEGTDRPTITMSAAASTIHFDAANTWLENFLVKTEHDNTVVIDIDESDCTVKNCEFRARTTATARQWVTCIDLNGGAANDCDRTHIVDCFFNSPDAGADNCIGMDEVCDSVVIEGCRFYADCSDACIHNVTGKVLTNLLIRNCEVSNLQSGDHAVELVSACTGQMSNCQLYGDTIAAILDPGALKCNAVLGTDAVDQSGVRLPGTSADALPDNSIAAATIAADAITEAKIADDAIDVEHLTIDVSANVVRGKSVTKSLTCANADVDMFDVNNGPVLITSLYGEVTTEIGATGSNMKIRTDDSSTQVDLCAAAGVDTDAVGTCYSITGTFATALQISTPGVLIGMTVPIVLKEGNDIHANFSAAPVGGVMSFTCHYIPLEAGATVTASA